MIQSSLQMIRRAGLVALAVAALGCLGQSPAVRHYAMSPVSGASARGSAPDAAVRLGPLSFPRYLERPQLVTRLGGSELSYDEFNRWAGGFESNVSRVLAINLSTRLDGAPVVLDGSAVASAIAYQIAVDIEQFEVERGDRLLLRARWAIRRTLAGGGVWMGQNDVLRRLERGDVASVVGAHDEALGELADRIAAQLASAMDDPSGS